MCVCIVYKGSYVLNILNSNCWTVRPNLLLLTYEEVTYQTIQIKISVRQIQGGVKLYSWTSLSVCGLWRM